MTMKKTELEKRKGLKIVNELRRSGPRPDASSADVDRRQQRERDRAAGLVPFAVKLHADLVRQLQALAEERGVPLGELVDGLLRNGLNTEGHQR
jgi:cytosine/adenosine deaminase-related metal-dependent hydrolase